MEKINEYYKTYTAEYCKSTGKPMYQNYEARRNLYSKTQCKRMGQPVAEGEEPVAFYRVTHGYCGLYARGNRS